MNDKVYTPKHYINGGIEVKDIWKAKLTKEQLKGAYLANIIKYVLRAENKNGLEDYKKASVYLQWLIELEQGEVKNENS